MFPNAFALRLRGYFVRSLFICLTICQVLSFSLGAWAGPSDQIPEGWESYLSRPDILQVAPQAAKMSASWAKIKKAQVAIVAELLELYPTDTQIYFLARDSEHLYDVARLATKGTTDASRMHLLNISRLTMEDSNVMAYLADNGITEQSLKKGQKVLFVDTGFAGSIPMAIQAKLSTAASKNLKTHLIVSETENFPSMRGFLVQLNQKSVNMLPAEMHNVIVDYEHIPRYTDRSENYYLVNGRYHPLSPTGNAREDDGTVSKTKALKQMKDIAADWETPTTKREFQALRKEIHDLIKVATMPDMTKMMNVLASRLQEMPQDKKAFAEAVLKDVFESARQTGLSVQVPFQRQENFHTTPLLDLLKTTTQIAKYPELKGLMDEPDNTIRKLFASKKTNLLRVLLSGEMGSEIAAQVQSEFFEEPFSGSLLELQKEVVLSAKRELVVRFFENKLRYYSFAQGFELFKVALQRGDSASMEAMVSLVGDLMSNPTDIGKKKEMARLIIASGKRKFLANLASSMSIVDPVKYKNELVAIIETGDKAALREIAEEAFRQIRSSDIVDLIPGLVQKAGIKSDITFALIGFASVEVQKSQEFKDTFYALIQSQDPDVIVKLVRENIAGRANSGGLLAKILRLASPKVLEPLSVVIKGVYGMDSNLFKSTKIIDLKQRNMAMDQYFGKDPEVAGVLEKMMNKDQVAAKKSVSTNAKSETKALPPVHKPSPDLIAGEFVQVGNIVYQVLDIGGEGLRGKVYKVRNQQGELFALKVAKDSDPETLASLQKETKKAESWAQFDVPHAEVLFQAKDHVLKTWVEGIGGEEIMERYFKGDAMAKKAVKALFEMVGTVMQQGAHLGDFRPPNVIWTTDRGWVVVDGGSVAKGMTVEEARVRWEEKFSRRWGVDFRPILPKAGKNLKCEKIFASAG